MKEPALSGALWVALLIQLFARLSEPPSPQISLGDYRCPGLSVAAERKRETQVWWSCHEKIEGTWRSVILRLELPSGEIERFGPFEGAEPDLWETLAIAPSPHLQKKKALIAHQPWGTAQPQLFIAEAGVLQHVLDFPTDARLLGLAFPLSGPVALFAQRSRLLSWRGGQLIERPAPTDSARLLAARWVDCEEAQTNSVERGCGQWQLLTRAKRDPHMLSEALIGTPGAPLMNSRPLGVLPERASLILSASGLGPQAMQIEHTPLDMRRVTKGTQAGPVYEWRPEQLFHHSAPPCRGPVSWVDYASQRGPSQLVHADGTRRWLPIVPEDDHAQREMPIEHVRCVFEPEGEKLAPWGRETQRLRTLSYQGAREDQRRPRWKRNGPLYAQPDGRYFSALGRRWWVDERLERHLVSAAPRSSLETSRERLIRWARSAPWAALRLSLALMLIFSARARLPLLLLTILFDWSTISRL
ncbi:MAG: hypothetical protein VYD19_07690 [Myxococcota bacterium]|nr:hypothetical protein [Myxococcota bacterium]